VQVTDMRDQHGNHMANESWLVDWRGPLENDLGGLRGSENNIMRPKIRAPSAVRDHRDVGDIR
jgi:hypothetical protein